MQRIPESELMDDPAQAIAYASADFEEAHCTIVENFQRVFPDISELHDVLDLGCGPADIAIRFANMYPNCKIDAVDGALEMLKQAHLFIAREDLQNRITLHLQRLPECDLPKKSYNAIVSNSLLHHLHNAQHLWSVVKKYATEKTVIFISDLIRPETLQAANLLVEQYAEDESEILRNDFFNSLLAAFTIDEVHAQLQEAQIKGLNIEQISDRHMLIYGNLH